MKCTKEYRLSLTEKAKKIVSEMTAKEKIHLMACNQSIIPVVLFAAGIGKYNFKPYYTGGCKRLNVPEMKFCDGPRGCVCGHSTCFPVPMARGATFDPELEERVGEAIAKEIRAHGGNYFGGVCLNVPYNPGAGRSQEVFGEDPHHIAMMGVALLKGIQNHNVIACIKHYAFNSMENARFYVDVVSDKRAEREVFLYQFKKCVDAGAASVMSAYNSYNGDFCGNNRYLLHDVLKTEWDFDGFVISDFFFGTHYTDKCIEAGLDVEMHVRRRYSIAAVKRELRRNRITMDMIEDAALRIVRTILAFTEAEDPQEYTKSIIACKEHIDLAREVAEKSITLIKNNNILPLNEQNIKRIALVGDLCDIENTGDHGSSMVRPPYIITLRKALEKNHPNIRFDFIPTKKVEKHSSTIENADAAIVMCGCNHGDEGEYLMPFGRTIGGDRKNLGLKDAEVEMVKTVGKLNKNTAVILMGGNMIRVHEWKDNVAAILMAYYPGMEGGNALDNILFGKINPSGKLPFAIGKSDEDFPEVDWTAKKAEYGYYHGYRLLDKNDTASDYPYGFGLSYTDFKLSDIKLETADEKTAQFKVTVQNVGDRAGYEVVQLYIGFNGSKVDRPVRVLRDFKRMHVNPSDSASVLLNVLKSDLAYYSEMENDWVSEDIEYTAYIGTDEKICEENIINFRFH